MQPRPMFFSMTSTSTIGGTSCMVTGSGAVLALRNADQKLTLQPGGAMHRKLRNFRRDCNPCERGERRVLNKSRDVPDLLDLADLHRLDLTGENEFTASKAFGSPPETWLEMQMAHELWQARSCADEIRVRSFKAA
jgi:hypothetical protein